MPDLRLCTLRVTHEDARILCSSLLLLLAGDLAGQAVRNFAAGRCSASDSWYPARSLRPLFFKKGGEFEGCPLERVDGRQPVSPSDLGLEPARAHIVRKWTLASGWALSGAGRACPTPLDGTRSAPTRLLCDLQGPPNLSIGARMVPSSIG